MEEIFKKASKSEQIITNKCLLTKRQIFYINLHGTVDVNEITPKYTNFKKIHFTVPKHCKLVKFSKKHDVSRCRIPSESIPIRKHTVLNDYTFKVGNRNWNQIIHLTPTTETSYTLKGLKPKQVKMLKLSKFIEYFESICNNEPYEVQVDSCRTLINKTFILKENNYIYIESSAKDIHNNEIYNILKQINRTKSNKQVIVLLLADYLWNDKNEIKKRKLNKFKYEPSRKRLYCINANTPQKQDICKSLINNYVKTYVKNINNSNTEYFILNKNTIKLN